MQLAFSYLLLYSISVNKNHSWSKLYVLNLECWLLMLFLVLPHHKLGPLEYPPDTSVNNSEWDKSIFWSPFKSLLMVTTFFIECLLVLMEHRIKKFPWQKWEHFIVSVKRYLYRSFYYLFYLFLERIVWANFENQNYFSQVLPKFNCCILSNNIM